MSSKETAENAVEMRNITKRFGAVLANESVYIRLVHERGWSPSAYARAVERALAGALGP